MKNEMIRLEDVVTMIYWIRNEKVKQVNKSLRIGGHKL